jgi:hypothetical protein
VRPSGASGFNRKPCPLGDIVIMVEGSCMTSRETIVCTNDQQCSVEVNTVLDLSKLSSLLRATLFAVCQHTVSAGPTRRARQDATSPNFLPYPCKRTRCDKTEILVNLDLRTFRLPIFLMLLIIRQASLD